MGRLSSDKGRTARPAGWRPQLTARERWLGLVFFAFYLLVFPFLVGFVGQMLEERVSILQRNTAYYTLVLLLLVAVFWDFLRHAITILKDNLRPSLFAFGAGFFAALVLTCLAGLIPLPVANPEIETYKLYLFAAPAATWAVAGFLKPVVDEILYRGLLFGTLRKENRVWAYVLSAGLFALSAVWQHALGNPACILLLIQYLPLGLVLCWSYDVSGSVFVPMGIRVAAQTLFLIFAAATPGEVLPMGI